MDNKAFAMWALVVAIGLIAVGLYFWATSSQQAGVSVPGSEEVIVAEVGNVDLGNLDAEFQSIDADLNQL